ncbi:MAG: hypothetical protein J4G09_04470 [Proteobacteria bacterium]|nr:hypothetical protein [Pseudomonadota bacterium]
MPDSITLKEDAVFKHQANLGEDLEDVEVSAGTELQVLQEWDDHYLAKDDDGKLFNVAKELADPE